MHFAWQAQYKRHLHQRCLGGQDASFLRGVPFWRIRSILLGRCSTLYDLASLFRGRRDTFHGWSGKIAKRIGTRPSAAHSTFQFCRKSRRIALFFEVGNSEF